MASLQIEFRGQTARVRIEGDRVEVGRDPACDLAVDDRHVSRVHLEVASRPGGGHDLIQRSTKKLTKRNGVPVTDRAPLETGDRIDAGPIRLTYLADDAAPGVPPSFAAVAPSMAASGVAVPPVLPARPVVPTAPHVEARGETPTDTAPLADERSVRAGARGRPRRRVGRLVLYAGVVGAAVLGLSFAIRGGGDDDGAAVLRGYRARLDAATRLTTTDIDAALASLDELAKPSTPLEGVRREAKGTAEAVRGRLEAARRDFGRLERDAATTDPTRLRSELRTLAETYGPLITRRFQAAVERGAASFATVEAARRAEVAESARALSAESKFGAAYAVLDAYEQQASWTDDTRKVLDEGRQEIEGRVGEAWRAAAAAAADVAASKGPAAAAMWLRERLPTFAGTPLARAVAERASAYDRDVVRPSASLAGAPPVPRPEAGGAPGGSSPGSPTPVLPRPPAGAIPAAPAPALSALARLEGLLADAQTKLSGRKIADALVALEEAARLAAGTSAAGRVDAALADATSARDATRLLGRTIREHPDRFQSFPIASSFAPSLVDADDVYVDASVPGGRTRIPWTTFDAGRLSRLVERARATGDDAVTVATLLHVVGADDAAERSLARAAGEGSAKGAIDARLARWRGEAVPDGGYVAHEGRLVAPLERERLLRDARIAAAVALVGSKDATKRRAAYAELSAIGAPAKEAFAAALRARRAAAVAEVAASRAFTSGHVRQRLGVELEKRRAAAIALIEDERAYPYPYTEAHEGQQEVDRLVDLVREVWERPFDLVSAWDASVRESLTLVAEVDEALAKVDDGYVPDMDAMKAAVNRAIDVPGLFPDEVSARVLAYNRKVATSATPQERDNVLAVNEYRIMMGRTAVKLDERLQRGARGHSIEMRRLAYFAHESPTPGLESPGKRCQREGYGGGVGENIAYGVTSGRAAFEGWFHSSGHHRNMLNKGWTEMGCGRSGPGHWTQCFGAMTGRGTKEPDALPPPRADVAPEPEGDDGMPREGATSGTGD